MPEYYKRGERHNLFCLMILPIFIFKKWNTENQIIFLLYHNHYYTQDRTSSIYLSNFNDKLSMLWFQIIHISIGLTLLFAFHLTKKNIWLVTMLSKCHMQMERIKLGPSDKEAYTQSLHSNTSSPKKFSVDIMNHHMYGLVLTGNTFFGLFFS